MPRVLPLAIVVCGLAHAALVPRAAAQDTTRLTFHIQPVRRAQLAVWIESEPVAGTVGYFHTVLLTQAVAERGIGNRPGALGLNSGYRYPYGRREGVLPVWAHRRVALGHQPAFPRVIFRNRNEGRASQSALRSPDPYTDNADPYFCLSFASESDPASRTVAGLDAVSCASTYNSDRGRYLTPDDVAAHYSEPTMHADGTQSIAMLGLTSLYPARRDIACPAPPAVCPNHPDTLRFVPDARAALPEIDAASQATLPDHGAPPVQFDLPTEMGPGRYFAFIEVNTEGDYNAHYDPASYPPPSGPDALWDWWAQRDGFPYRGQPSVVYRVAFTVPTTDPMMDVVETSAPVGHGTVDGRSDADTTMVDMSDGTITTGVPGSGAERLLPLGAGGARVRLEVRSPMYCDGALAPAATHDLVATPVADIHHSHHWAHLAFTAPMVDRPVTQYRVRVSTTPITDLDSFDNALPANAATIDTVGLVVPTGAAAGAPVAVDLGGLAPVTHYWVGVEALTECASGPIAVADFWTTTIHFTTVSPCFVATAAYGSPEAQELGVLRRFRDRQLRTSAPGRALVGAYYAVGPRLATVIAGHDALRAAVRGVLAPVIAFARALDD